MITLSLAHFCEVHGPNIVFTSQRIPAADDARIVLAKQIIEGVTPLPPGTY
jgi:hypothetical protein